jgi:hypothetical protein
MSTLEQLSETMEQKFAQLDTLMGAGDDVTEQPEGEVKAENEFTYGVVVLPNGQPLTIVPA